MIIMIIILQLLIFIAQFWNPKTLLPPAIRSMKAWGKLYIYTYTRGEGPAIIGNITTPPPDISRVRPGATWAYLYL